MKAKAKLTLWLLKNRKLIVPGLILIAAVVVWLVWFR